ncbi:hypothetical protein HGRIS_010051 [Hohenbuehelia grisea]|uniref:RING-type domain-containing protein n=1 Tax=Hohenbuehelia grisea TaxID=104357 RepID=A0ABR3J351_9AGAR
MNFLSPPDRARLMIRELPKLTQQDIKASIEDNCPICLMSFSSIFAEEDHNATKGEAQRNEGLNLGVTKLEGCGHVFCRSDLAEWISSLHGSCPTCRHVFLDVRPPSDSDDESSDGGEYIPEDEDEDEDIFLDTDGFSEDMDYDVEMEWDDGDIWEHEVQRDLDAMDEWGLSDGDSLSEGDLSYNYEGHLDSEAQVDVAIAGDHGTFERVVVAVDGDHNAFEDAGDEEDEAK